MLSSPALAKETHQAYYKIVEYVQQLIRLEQQQVTARYSDELEAQVNHIYRLTIAKYQSVHDLLVFENEEGLQREDRAKWADFSDL